MKNTHTFYKNTFTPGFRVKPVIIYSDLMTEMKIIKIIKVKVVYIV